MVVQTVSDFRSNCPPLVSFPRTSDAITATSSSTFARLTTASRASATVRRWPSCSSRRRGRRHASGRSSSSSGTIGMSQTHQGKTQSCQAWFRLTEASTSCIAITIPTAGAASHRDSISSSRNPATGVSVSATI